MNPLDLQVLIAKLKDLSPERLAEVEDFVDFLHSREQEARADAARLGQAMAKLAAIDVPPLSGDDIEVDIDPVQHERRGRFDLDC